MGVVYAAEQRSPRRDVALKVIRGGQFIDELHVRMFQREAETLARLKHPDIAAIYEAGRTGDGQHYFAMELVQGETLGTFMAARPQDLQAGELRFRLRLLRRICDAVHYAHQRGVIHRDLKPSNIIVTGTDGQDSDGTSGIKILDFGLARITDADLAGATMATEVGVIKGTLAYMSPEQARGDPADVDVPHGRLRAWRGPVRNAHGDASLRDGVRPDRGAAGDLRGPSAPVAARLAVAAAASWAISSERRTRRAARSRSSRRGMPSAPAIPMPECSSPVQSAIWRWCWVTRGGA